jgi:hypothetical protein
MPWWLSQSRSSLSEPWNFNLIMPISFLSLELAFTVLKFDPFGGVSWQMIAQRESAE